VVELKAIQKILPGSAAQVINYLKASQLSRGLILNSGRKSGVPTPDKSIRENPQVLFLKPRSPFSEIP
jgi:hypothetical protein